MAYSGTELLLFGFWLLRDWRVVEKAHDRDICAVVVALSDSDEGIATLRRAGRATILDFFFFGGGGIGDESRCRW